MSRILLVDDSPHAQRLGERILSEEGFEVVTVSNADSALIRIEDVDPDVVLADTVMPGRTGYEICQYLKMSPRHRHVRVILTAGVLEPIDDERVRGVDADGFLKKPFEASALVASVRPLAERAVRERMEARQSSRQPANAVPPAVKAPAAPFIAVVDAEQVRAAVTVALDASMDAMVDEIARRVVAALGASKPAAEPQVDPVPAPAPLRPPPPVPSPVPVEAMTRRSVNTPLPTLPQTLTRTPARMPPLVQPQVITRVPAPASSVLPPAPAEPPESDPVRPPAPRLETVRRVNPIRSRPGSILGLDVSYREPETTPDAPRSAPNPDAGPPSPASDAPGPRPLAPD